MDSEVTEGLEYPGSVGISTINFTTYEFDSFMASKRMDSDQNLIIGSKYPVNLVPEDRRLFENPEQQPKVSPYLQEHRDIRISSEGLLFKNGRIMRESFSYIKSFERWKNTAHIKAYLHNFVLRTHGNLEKALWITDDWSDGYFHWMCDALPKLVIANNYDHSSRLLLPSRFRGIEFVSSSLAKFGISEPEFINENETVTVGRLFVPVHSAQSGDFDDATINKVRRILLGSLPHRKIAEKRIFISRRIAKRRRIINEEEFLDVLNEYKFEVVFAEDLSFEEQASLFASTRLLVSVHGAGLSNMLFMPDEGRVFELRKNGMGVPNCYLNLASALRHKFYYQLCLGKNESEAPHSADLIVDKEMFENNLRRFVSDL